MNEEELQLYKYLNGLISYPFTRDSRNKILEMFSDVLKQNEAYENMRKKLKNRIEYTNFKDVEDLKKFKSYLDELMNILNKVGEDNETI